MVIRRGLTQGLVHSCFGGVLGMVLRGTLASAKGYDRQQGTWTVDKRVYAKPMTRWPSWVLQSTLSLGQGQSGCRFALPSRVPLLYSRELVENTFKSHISIFIPKNNKKYSARPTIREHLCTWEFQKQRTCTLEVTDARKHYLHYSRSIFWSNRGIVERRYLVKELKY